MRVRVASSGPSSKDPPAEHPVNCSLTKNRLLERCIVFIGAVDDMGVMLFMTGAMMGNCDWAFCQWHSLHQATPILCRGCMSRWVLMCTLCMPLFSTRVPLENGTECGNAYCGWRCEQSIPSTIPTINAPLHLIVHPRCLLAPEESTVYIPGVRLSLLLSWGRRILTRFCMLRTVCSMPCIWDTMMDSCNGMCRIRLNTTTPLEAC